ncbi:putative F-box protein At3g23260 [Cornus florida]|uniref:putative F-box protein At3g23260 n=1 Tax=Cornus florida TaxID=4283 RepID=UPI00289A9F03|nr:putative F-box protein At3g23260 [Cornus florida]
MTLRGYQRVVTNSKTYRANLAFEFLPGVNDYKVVRILCSWGGDIRIPDIVTGAEVYSLSTDSWRIIDGASSYFFADQLPAIGNGAAYWVAMKRTDEGFCCLLVRFDMGDEVFEDIMLPNGATHGCCPHIAIMGESLYLFPFHSNECCHLWTMECGNMGSWTKRFTLNFQDPPLELLGLRKSGELLQVNRKSDLGHCLLLGRCLCWVAVAVGMCSLDLLNCEEDKDCDAAIYQEHLKKH